MSNTRVLFNWQPPVLDRSLDERFRECMAAAGLECLGIVEVRDPGRNQYIETPKRWHRDDSSSELLIAMWSNVRPTEVRFADGRLLEGTQDGDIILVDNNEVEHRAPEDQTDRWFIRTSVVEGKHTKQHESISGRVMDVKEVVSKRKERTYSYEQFRRKFMPKCPQHCFCRKGFFDKRMARFCCHCGEREP